MLKPKTSRWLAGPYLLWMAAFIIVPLFIVIWYALTNADGRFTLDNLTQIGRYSSVFMRSLILAAVSTAICLVMAFPVGYFLSRLRANKQHIMLMLSAAHLCVDDFAVEERPHQQVFWPVRPRTL